MSDDPYRDMMRAMSEQTFGRLHDAPPPAPEPQQTGEAYPEAAAILAQAGWKPHDGWGVYTRDTLVMGFQPDGQAFHVKNWAAIMEGHPQWSPDTPDTAEEAAAWLVERFKPAPNDLTTEATLDPVALQSEQVGNPGDESNGETGVDLAPGGAEATPDDPYDRSALCEDESPSASSSADTGDGYAAEGKQGLVESLADNAADFTDADFTEGEDLGAELLDVEAAIIEGEDLGFTSLPNRPVDIEFDGELLALDAPPPEDFAPDEIVTQEPAPSVAIFGPPADDTETLRSQRIGDVVRLSMAKQDAVWAASGTTRDTYDGLVSAVMRDTNNGLYTGPADQFARFTSLQTWANAAAAVKEHERVQVRFLAGAERPDLDAFDPEAGWP